MGGESLVRKILEIFSRRAPDAVRRAREALESGDRAELERLAHGLVSSAAYVGAADVVGHARALEEKAPEADIATLADLAGRLDDAIAEVLPEVLALCGEIHG